MSLWYQTFPSWSRVKVTKLFTFLAIGMGFGLYSCCNLKIISSGFEDTTCVLMVLLDFIILGIPGPRQHATW